MYLFVVAFSSVTAEKMLLGVTFIHMASKKTASKAAGFFKADTM